MPTVLQEGGAVGFYDLEMDLRGNRLTRVHLQVPAPQSGF